MNKENDKECGICKECFWFELTDILYLKGRCLNLRRQVKGEDSCNGWKKNEKGKYFLF